MLRAIICVHDTVCVRYIPNNHGFRELKMVNARGKTAVKKNTITDMVRQRLEDEIKGGVYKEGQHIEEVALAARLDCSRTPVREAINQLVAMGLLVRRNHCGVHVAPKPVFPPQDLIEALVELEVLYVVQILARMTPLDRSQLAARQLDLLDCYTHMQDHFGNGVLKQTIQTLRAHVAPDVLQVLTIDVWHRQLLVAAMLRGDTNTATAILREQIQASQGLKVWHQAC